MAVIHTRERESEDTITKKMVERRLETVQELISVPTNQELIENNGSGHLLSVESADLKRDLTRKHSGESEGK